MKELSLTHLLERWGLRVIGGTMKSPLKLSSGGEAGLDDDLLLVAYVESTPGFDRAKPVLRHVFSEGLPLESFRLRMPGELRSKALIRWGWFDLAGLRDADIPGRILDEFETTLSEKMRVSPYGPPAWPHNDSAYHIL